MTAEISPTDFPEEAILVTHNTREFRRVDGLQVEDWAVSF